MKNLNKFNHNFFSKPNLLNSYWAGFIAADGCIYIPKDNSQRLLQIRLAKLDRKHLEKFSEQLNFLGELGTKQKRKGSTEQTTINLSSDKICLDLKKNFNITPRKSLTLKPPKHLTKKQALAFIVGYIDGDGCIYNARKYLGLEIVGTKKMLFWIKCRLKSTKVNLKTNNVTVFGKQYKFQMLGKKTEVLLAFLNRINVPKLKRKWDKICI